MFSFCGNHFQRQRSWGNLTLCYSLFQAWVKNGESLKSKLGGIRGQWNTETNFQCHPPNLMKKTRTLRDYLISCRACVVNIKIQPHSPEWICNLALEDPKLWVKIEFENLRHLEIHYAETLLFWILHSKESNYSVYKTVPHQMLFSRFHYTQRSFFQLSWYKWTTQF